MSFRVGDKIRVIVKGIYHLTDYNSRGIIQAITPTGIVIDFSVMTGCGVLPSSRTRWEINPTHLEKLSRTKKDLFGDII